MSKSPEVATDACPSAVPFMSFAPWFRRWTALVACVLLLLTYRLWLPQTVFPRVPLVGFAIGWSDGVDLLAFGAMLCGLLLTITPQRERFGWLVFAAAFGLSVLADQHRLQPWAYQFAILAVVFTTAGDGRQLPLARWLAIGIVFHSAHSKLDHAFLDEQGRAFLEYFVGFLGLDTKFWAKRTWLVLASALPVGELLVAIGLVVPRTRRVAAWLLTGMHMLLLVVFGSLAHSWGVLLWNVFAIGQILLLFTPWRAGGVSPLLTSESHEDGQPGPRASRPHERRSTAIAGETPAVRVDRRSFLWLGELAVGLAILLPFLEPFGLVDHWTAWAVYASRTERVSLFIPADHVDDLPPTVRPHASPVAPPGYVRVRLDHWSLTSLGVPLYPQERFRIGVCLAVVEALPDDVPVRVVVDDVPDRLTGERERTVLDDRESVAERAASFTWNAMPKRMR